MKGLSILGLGVAIWSLGLLWPELNKIPGWPVMVGLIMGVGSIVMTYILSKPSRNHRKGQGTNKHPSGPVPVVVTR